MRNQPNYLTTGGGARPEWLPTRRQACWSRVNTTVHAIGQHGLHALDDVPATRFRATLTVLAMIALASTVFLGQHTAYAMNRTLASTPTLSAVRSSASLDSPARPLAVDLGSATRAEPVDTRPYPGHLPLAVAGGSSSRSTTAFTPTEAGPAGPQSHPWPGQHHHPSTRRRGGRDRDRVARIRVGPHRRARRRRGDHPARGRPR